MLPALSRVLFPTVAGELPKLIIPLEFSPLVIICPPDSLMA